MSDTKLNILVGPYRAAKRYAENMGWHVDSYVIVVRAHQMWGLDPARIGAIIAVKMHTMSKKIIEEIYAEIDLIRQLWPVALRVAS